jgi:hypothetical protein
MTQKRKELIFKSPRAARFLSANKYTFTSTSRAADATEISRSENSFSRARKRFSEKLMTRKRFAEMLPPMDLSPGGKSFSLESEIVEKIPIQRLFRWRALNFN